MSYKWKYNDEENWKCRVDVGIIYYPCRVIGETTCDTRRKLEPIIAS